MEYLTIMGMALIAAAVVGGVAFLRKRLVERRLQRDLNRWAAELQRRQRGGWLK